MHYKIYHFNSLTSTQDKAREFAKKGLSDIIIIAKKQTKGKGRFKRKWDSELGGLYMTMLLKEKNLENARYLTFIASIAVADSIKKLINLNAKVKWPNDVLINNKKVCGILTETMSAEESYAIIGIGANVNQESFSKSISKTATSLKIESNKNFNIKKLLKIIINEFDKLYAYYKNGNFKKIISIWKKYSHTLGKKIRVKTLSCTYAGRAVSVDKNCNLLLKLKNNKIIKIIEGDIKVYPE